MFRPDEGDHGSIRVFSQGMPVSGQGPVSVATRAAVQADVEKLNTTELSTEG